ncbi:hypothetical protein BGX33_010281 [Mortierella sp. NVP41]|nr:hypothetical protein BGX33_010281 [Mortierella sp. NVP41]
MPPLTTLEQELAEEEKVLRAEQEWFLTTQVTPSLEAIQKALVASQDAARLQDDAKGALTLAISSPKQVDSVYRKTFDMLGAFHTQRPNDTLKGFVTLAGSFIVKGELTIKLPKLPVVKAAIHSQVPASISAAQSLLTASNTASTGGGSSSSSSSSVTGALGGAENNSEETTTAAAATAADGSEVSKSDDGQQGSHQQQQQPSTAMGLAAAIGAATGFGIGSVVVPTTTTTPAGATIAAGSTGSGATSVPGSQLNTHQLLHSYRPPGHITLPYALEQLRDVQNHTAQAIFRLEDYRKWRGESTNVGEGATLDIKEITRALKTMLELLERHIRASIEAMAQPGKEKLYPFRVCDPKIFSPALSEDFVIEFYIRDSHLVCAAYALHLSTGSSGNNGQSSAGNALTTYLQQALPGASSSTSSSSVAPTAAPQPSSSLAVAGASLGSFSDHHHPPALSASSHVSNSGNGGGKGGHGTPRPSSPLHHHNPTSGHPSHASHQSHLTQQGGAGGGGGGRPPKPWSPARSPSTPQVPHHHPEAVVLPSSDKIGQTSKGGINKYRGKIATTIEDKVVEVESPKLAEITTRLIYAESLCRRLLHFLVLQDSVAASPY